MRDTQYATELASAEVDYARVERLRIKSDSSEEIRFSWWKDGRMMMRPLDLPEEDLLDLLRAGIEKGVFAQSFLNGLRDLLNQTHRA